MKFSIEVKEKWDGDVFKKTLIPKVEYRCVREAGIFCQGQAVLLCPVDKGRLRSSIGLKMKGQKVIGGARKVPESQPDDDIKEEPAMGTAHVGTNVIYAAAQEFGMQSGYGNYKGPGFPAQPYLRPAADLTEGKSITIIEQGGRQEFEGYEGIK